jgi:hypothetical protein
VRARAILVAQDENLIQAGDVGEIHKVVRDAPGDTSGIAYHVHFDALPGRVLRVPEAMLAPNEVQHQIQTQAPETAPLFSCPPPAKPPARENLNPNHRS